MICLVSGVMLLLRLPFHMIHLHSGLLLQMRPETEKAGKAVSNLSPSHPTHRQKRNSLTNQRAAFGEEERLAMERTNQRAAFGEEEGPAMKRTNQRASNTSSKT